MPVEIQFRFPDGGTVRVGGPVKVGERVVGRVLRADLDPRDGKSVLVTAEIDDADLDEALAALVHGSTVQHFTIQRPAS